MTQLPIIPTASSLPAGDNPTEEHKPRIYLSEAEYDQLCDLLKRWQQDGRRIWSDAQMAELLREQLPFEFTASHVTRARVHLRLRVDKTRPTLADCAALNKALGRVPATAAPDADLMDAAPETVLEAFEAAHAAVNERFLPLLAHACERLAHFKRPNVN